MNTTKVSFLVQFLFQIHARPFILFFFFLNREETSEYRWLYDRFFWSRGRSRGFVPLKASFVPVLECLINEQRVISEDPPVDSALNSSFLYKWTLLFVLPPPTQRVSRKQGRILGWIILMVSLYPNCCSEVCFSCLIEVHSATTVFRSNFSQKSHNMADNIS